MLEFIKYKRNEVEIIDPDGKSLGFADEYTLLDIQCQIAEQKLEGYTCKWEDTILTINSKGELSDWPNGMFDLSQVLFARAFKARTGNRIDVDFMARLEKYKQK